MDFERETRKISRQIERAQSRLWGGGENGAFQQALRSGVEVARALVHQFLEIEVACQDAKRAISGIIHIRQTLGQMESVASYVAKDLADMHSFDGDLLDFWESMMGLRALLEDKQRDRCASIFALLD